MTPAELSRTVRRAVCRAVTDGELGVRVPERILIDRPRPGGTGDWATNAALALAGPAGRPPVEVAEILRARLDGTPGILGVDVTGPGFLNFTLAPPRAGDVADAVLRAGAHHGHGTALQGTHTLLAAAPGPRAAAWTRTVARLLRTQGATAEAVPAGSSAPHAEPSAPAPARPATVPLGRDELRWAYLSVPAATPPRPGPALLVQREENPLFLVRYAHARTRALARNAAGLGLFPLATGGSAGEPPATAGPAGAAVAGLVRALLDHPAVLEAAARLRAPDRLARHLAVLADAVLTLQQHAHPLPRGDEKPSAAHRTRLALAEAAGTVLAGGLTLLGIDAPAHL